LTVLDALLGGDAVTIHTIVCVARECSALVELRVRLLMHFNGNHDALGQRLTSVQMPLNRGDGADGENARIKAFAALSLQTRALTEFETQTHRHLPRLKTLELRLEVAADNVLGLVDPFAHIVVYFPRVTELAIVTDRYRHARGRSSPTPSTPPLLPIRSWRATFHIFSSCARHRRARHGSAAVSSFRLVRVAGEPGWWLRAVGWPQ
jgi:hypothetical protein